MFMLSSVTRFCEISPLLANKFKFFCIFKGFFNLCQNVEPTLTNSLMLLGKFSLLQIKIVYPSDHTDAFPLRDLSFVGRGQLGRALILMNAIILLQASLLLLLRKKRN